VNTEFITKTVGKHKKATAFAGGTSVALIIFAFEHFTTKAEMKDHCHDCKMAHSENWQKLQDHELEIDRMKR